MSSDIFYNQHLDGFCWGDEDTTIDEESRIRLCKTISETLITNNITELWRFPAFTFRGIILCPPQNVKLYRETVINYFQSIENPDNWEIAYRKYISPGSLKKIGSQGRITLSQTCRTLSEISPSNFMAIIGVGSWYEVWHYDDYQNEMAKAEALSPINKRQFAVTGFSTK